MLQSILPSYLYVQYNDDANLQALVQSFNLFAQEYVNTLLTLNLPIYTQYPVSGALLDWVAAGVYGLYRPALSTSTGVGVYGPLNSVPFNTIPFNGNQSLVTNVYAQTSDDVFRRYMTWVLYRGDGARFTVKWLKRRVMRFLYGVNGTDPGISQTTPVSVVFSGSNNVTITVTRDTESMAIAGVFQAALDAKVLPLPFEYNYTVVLI